jgi:hypothetical protein
MWALCKEPFILRGNRKKLDYTCLIVECLSCFRTFMSSRQHRHDQSLCSQALSSNGLCLVALDIYGMYPCFFNSVVTSDSISDWRCQGSELDRENICTFTSDTHLTSVEKKIQIYKLHYHNIQLGFFINFFSFTTEVMQTRLMLHTNKSTVSFMVWNVVAGCLFF